MVQKTLRRYLLALGVVLVLDIVWLGILAGPFYRSQVGPLMLEDIRIASGLLAWALIPLGVVLFVDQVAKGYRQVLGYGAVYGLILYGLYEFTNHAIIAAWTIPVVIVDIMWGVFICSVTALALRFSEERWGL